MPPASGMARSASRRTRTTSRVRRKQARPAATDPARHSSPVRERPTDCRHLVVTQPKLTVVVQPADALGHIGLTAQLLQLLPEVALRLRLLQALLRLLVGGKLGHDGHLER